MEEMGSKGSRAAAATGGGGVVSGSSSGEARRQATEWNQRGVSLNQAGTLLESLDCYLQAVQCAPDEWLGYQNAGHAAVQMQWWEGAIFFHARTRALDTKYDQRKEADKCECLTYATDKLRSVKKTNYKRLWAMEDFLQALNLPALSAESQLDPCFTLPRHEGRYKLTLDSHVFWFDTVHERQVAIASFTVCQREAAMREAQAKMLQTAGPGHPFLRGDLLQHIFSFMVSDYKNLCTLGLVCKSFLAVSLRNTLWRDVFRLHNFDPPLRPEELELLDNVVAFGHDGFLKRLLLQHPPIVYVPANAAASNAKEGQQQQAQAADNGEDAGESSSASDQE